ncbi:hypothetical protein MKEN_01171000 [Mycena kentingensis (nom. inval.)]|nr:hypothetical protein MKEN_01171000 [Mycena kentingensis (nom. inval.)]
MYLQRASFMLLQALLLASAAHGSALHINADRALGLRATGTGTTGSPTGTGTGTKSATATNPATTGAGDCCECIIALAAGGAECAIALVECGANPIADVLCVLEAIEAATQFPKCLKCAGLA